MWNTVIGVGSFCLFSGGRQAVLCEIIAEATLHYGLNLCYELQSKLLKEGYIGDYIGDYYRGY